MDENMKLLLALKSEIGNLEARRHELARRINELRERSVVPALASIGLKIGDRVTGISGNEYEYEISGAEIYEGGGLAWPKGRRIRKDGKPSAAEVCLYHAIVRIPQ